MNRPNIEETKDYIKELCCGIPTKVGFCESFGCSDVLPLIEYIEFLEASASQQADSADSLCRECGSETGLVGVEHPICDGCAKQYR